MTKTNAMRMLNKAKIPYDIKEYKIDESDLSGTHVAKQVGMPFGQVFKTLVAKGDKTGPVVLCIPVDKELDLKKAAVVTKNKKLEMIAVKDLLGLTGYIRGGCSPIGMKKKFPMFICTSCMEYETIAISAGVRGCQLILSPDKLVEYTTAVLCEITV